MIKRSGYSSVARTSEVILKDKRSAKGEAQYQEPIRTVKSRGTERLGLMTSWAYLDDPRRLAFTFSRYKFVSKMLAGAEHVLEIGCGDGFATRIVVQSVRKLTAVDFDQSFVDDANSRMLDPWRFNCHQHDILDGPVPGQFDGVYSLDVLEHIPMDCEDRFMRNLVSCMTDTGVAIIGMPSLQSQAYASPQSKEGHVNCKDQNDLRKFLQRYFRNVFAFSMNDEVVHTGYSAMSHYNLGLCCGRLG